MYSARGCCKGNHDVRMASKGCSACPNYELCIEVLVVYRELHFCQEAATVVMRSFELVTIKNP